MTNNPISIYSCENWQALMINSFLKAKGIQSSIKNNLMSTIAPWEMGSVQANPAEIQVPSSESDWAIDLLKEYLNKEAS